MVNLVKLTKAGYKAAIQYVLAKKAKYLTPRQLLEEEAYYKDFADKLIPRYFEKGAKLSSVVHNRNMEALYISINGLDSQVSELYQKAQTHFLLTDSEISKARQALKHALVEARAFSLQLQNRNFDSVAVSKLDENYTTASPAAIVEPLAHYLRASAASYTDAHVVDYLATSSAAEVTFFGGGVPSGLAAIMPPKYMLDYHDGTAWADSILSDGPISTTVGDTVYHGPLAEIVVTVALPQPVNYLRILPFSFFPQKLLKLEYKSAASAEEWAEIQDFSATYLEDVYHLHFQPCHIAQLKLTLLQEHAKQLVISAPHDAVQRAAVFSALLDSRNKAIAGLGVQYAEDAIGPYYNAANEELSKLFNPSQLDSWSKKLKSMTESIVQELGAKDTTNDTIAKFEYLFGIRSLDLGYIRYDPTCYYTSETFLPGATISTVNLHVNQILPGITSTEWYLDFGQDKVVPILPIECKSGQYGIVEHEVLDVTLGRPYDYTRFPVSGAWQLYQDGNPMETGTFSVQTGEYLKITIPEPVPSAYYTISYTTPSSSTEVDVLASFSSRPLERPESFTDTGPDNDIELSLYPYVAYEVINNTGDFSYDSLRNSWVFERPGSLYGTGHLRIYPRVLDSYGHILVSGESFASGVPASFGPRTGQSAPDFDAAVGSLGTGYFEPPYGYYFGIERFPRAFKVTGEAGAILYLEDPPTFTVSELGLLNQAGFSGSLTGAPYSAQIDTEYFFGVGLDLDGIIYGFEAGEYVPITVTVGGEAARNHTDYETLEHAAFDSNKGKVEFIHAGRKIYFNQPIHNKEILVDYRWTTKYLRFLATLRAGGVYKPQQTPQVFDAYALINTTIL